jgi:nitrogen fixation protein NifU and related proteins
MAGDDLYREYLVELYRHPHNFGLMPSPNVRQEGVNPLCGDQVTIDLALDGEQVREARFTGKGCAVSIAAASILTDLAPSRTVPDLMAMGETQMVEEMGLGALTPARVKCAVLALKTLQAGIEGASDGAHAGAGARGKRIVTTEEG